MPAAARRARTRSGCAGCSTSDAVEIEREHAVADRRRPGREAGIEQPEEHQHEQQDQRVLDADQQLPDRAARTSSIRSSNDVADCASGGRAGAAKPFRRTARAASARRCPNPDPWQPLPAAGATSFARRARLAWPLVLAQLTQIAIYSTDVLMLGWLGAEGARGLGPGGEPHLHVQLHWHGVGHRLRAADRGRARRAHPRSARRAAQLPLGDSRGAALCAARLADAVELRGDPAARSARTPSCPRQPAASLRVLQWTLLPNLLIVIFGTLLTALGRRARRSRSPLRAWSSTPRSTRC